MFENEAPFSVHRFHQYLPQLPAHSGMSAIGVCEACASCAVVGASGTLLRHEHGALIDSHELVLRPNGLKLKGFEEHTGRRTSLNVFFALEKMLEQFLLAQRKLPLAQRAIGLATPDSKLVINSYFSYLGRQKYNISQPSVAPLYLLSDRLWQRAIMELCAATDGGCLWPTRTPTMRPSTGFFAVLVALHICRNVSLFGFTSDPCLPSHYYTKDDGKCVTGQPHKVAVPKQNDVLRLDDVRLDTEHEIYGRWARKGLVRAFS